MQLTRIGGVDVVETDTVETVAVNAHILLGQLRRKIVQAVVIDVITGDFQKFQQIRPRSSIEPVVKKKKVSKRHGILIIVGKTDFVK